LEQSVEQHSIVYKYSLHGSACLRILASHFVYIILLENTLSTINTRFTIVYVCVYPLHILCISSYLKTHPILFFIKPKVVFSHV